MNHQLLGGSFISVFIPDHQIILISNYNSHSKLIPLKVLTCNMSHTFVIIMISMLSDILVMVVTEEPRPKTLTETSLTMATFKIYKNFISCKCPW